jgi:uncharacterized protein YajQ (UPF0234 family)
VNVHWGVPGRGGPDPRRGVAVPSVDVVSVVDLQSIDNAVNNTKREITTRFDFRNVTTEIVFDRKEKRIHVLSGDESKVKAISEMLARQAIRLKVDPQCLDFQKIEPTSRGAAKMDVAIKEGVPIETCREVVKLIKGLKTKVQSSIQGDQVRITGKKIDDLQAIMKLLREQEYGVPLQFVNMKR